MTSFFSDLLLALSERGRSFVDLQQQPSEARDIVAIAKALLSQKGEASGIALASEFFAIYDQLDAAQLDDFFLVLAEQFGPDLEGVIELVDGFEDGVTVEGALALHGIAEPRRQELFRRLNQAPEGTLKLVRLREDLLDRLETNPELAMVDADLLHLFQSWFNRGFLVLKRITWSTPASVLEKIIKYEAVHEIASWEELRQRVEPADRLCYAFFHPSLVEEPLIFVEVALNDHMPEAIQPVIAHRRQAIDAHTANLATFYSISNCQRGLTGISFGSFLIKQVAEDLLQELPHIKSFVTLSPVPGFMKWLNTLINRPGDSDPVLSESEFGVLRDLLAAEWRDEALKQQVMKELLLPLSAWYFMYAKDQLNKPLDAVARFHLGNGARLERINWRADCSSKSLAQSAGIMVNYLYDLGDIENNHEAFANEDCVIAASAITKMAKTTSSSKTMENV